MVSSIVPGATGANALGVDTRYARAAQPQRREEPANADKIELSSAAIGAARESVLAGMAQVHEALAAGHDAQAMLVRVQGLARSGDQARLSETLAAFDARVSAAIDRGAAVLSGQDIVVQAEPGAPGVTISGVDLRIKAEPSPADLIAVSAEARADDPALAQAAQKSMEMLQEAMGRLIDSARSLEAHQGFLGAAEAGARGDFDADGARLLALQVRQGLEAVGGGPIANAEPQAVLSLFRA
ncbi:MAG: hypothetical protein AB7T59_12170 [Hyphomonadaceae bacterium]